MIIGERGTAYIFSEGYNMLSGPEQPPVFVKVARRLVAVIAAKQKLGFVEGRLQEGTNYCRAK